MWWQIQRLALFIFVLDAAVIGLAAAGCLLFGALTKINFATVLLGLAVLLAFAAAGFGDGPARLPFPVSSRAYDRTLYESQVRAEMEQGLSPIDRTREGFLVKQPSWPLALGLAAVPLVALSAFLAT